MSDLSSPIIGQAAGDVSRQLQLLMQAQRGTQVATLAAAVVAAMGRPVSIAEVLEINNSIWFSLYSDGQHGRYQEWAKTKDERLAKINA